MQWIEIHVEVHPEAVETVSEILSDYATGGVAIEEPYTLEDDGQRWQHIPNAPVSIRAYIPDDEHASPIVQRIEENLWHVRSIGEQFIGLVQTATVHDEDWAETWKEHFHVTHIGKRIIIKPTWREYTPTHSNEAIIELDPGMAFGSGLHPTTRLCLEALEDVVFPDARIIDVGTGSGILTIGAMKLGAGHTIGIDISTVAVKTAQQNCALNHLEDRVEILQGTLSMSDDGIPLIIPAPPEPGEDPGLLLHMIRAIEPAPIVVANIIARIIGAMAPALLAATAPGGTLITSGIIADREHEALDPLIAAGLINIVKRQEGDWICIIGRRQA